MRLRDRLALALFVVVLAATVLTVAVVIAHERTHHTAISAQQEHQLLKLCRNPGNGGC